MKKKDLQEELNKLRAVNKALNQQIATQHQYILNLKQRMQETFGQVLD